MSQSKCQQVCVAQWKIIVALSTPNKNTRTTMTKNIFHKVEPIALPSLSIMDFGSSAKLPPPFLL